MMRKMLVVFIYLTVADADKNESFLLLRTIQALNDALEYMDSQVENINLDGVLGVRVTDDQLQVLVNSPIKEIYRPMIPFLSELQSRAESIADRSISYVKQQDPIYYDGVGNALTNGIWELDNPNRRLETSQKYDENLILDSFFNGSASDKCMGEVIGQSQSEYCHCSISEDCWSYMTMPNYSAYKLTHEVIFLQFIQGCGCNVDQFIEKSKQESYDSLVNYLCSRVFIEAKQIFESPEISGGIQDLFMEQIGICGMNGFVDFYRPEWLEAILSWQDFNGCFKMKPEKNELRRKRIKRTEKWLEDGCLSHKTAVALIALIVNIRFIMTPF